MKMDNDGHVAAGPKFACISLVVIVAICIMQTSFLSHWNPWMSCDLLFALTLCTETIINVNSVVITCGFLVVFIHRRFRNCTRKTFEQKIAEGMPCAEITTIIPCFLPNEQDIIEGTIDHVMNKLQSPGTMKLIIVYNTPKDMPEVEDKLRQMEKRTDWKDGRRLEVMRVHTSKSKAENLNYAISKVSSEYIAIYDADHNPDPGSLMRLYQEMWEQNADSVLGSLYIRNLNYSWMARWIDIDLSFVHFCVFSGMILWTRLGFFGGSNAIVRKEALTSEPFNPAVQCEDIDLSARWLLANRKLVLCPEARCGELAPADYKAFYRQRLRWFMGWDQVTLRYIGQANFRSKLPCYYKVCFYYFFIFRWLGPAYLAMNVFSSVWLSIFTPTSFLKMSTSQFEQDKYSDFLQQVSTPFGYLSMILSLVEMICQACNPGFQRSACQCVLQLFWLVIYLMAIPLYMAWWVVVESTAIVKIFTKSTGNWIVTVRSTAKNQSTPLSSPLLDKK